ncbi:MAG: DUF3747 domain-containing protein [Geminocystis sp.]|nr:DUF3747 domain-containing protein [Geminocystis sp.]HIK37994.1 DUF3747 domain-containing protein [Geminocystis sp. M7585_C2015_104]MCS7148121.1 DUF3747 domain-containing protein [Geminocystis sp.]MCX8077866.1 DUF3747 domain-containing protein [Geminocystis sp.]MDW8116472.1 DUF3747 domain-containing protein [Geminocystis sp.]
MWKSSILRGLAVLLLATGSGFVPTEKAGTTVTFQETEVKQEDFIAVAQPLGGNRYNLLVIEQIPKKNRCWREEGENPVSVDLLLLNFDFTGHCRRSTDANGYSIRYDGQDYGLDYILALVERNGEVVLMGYNRRNTSASPIVVGSTRGISRSPMKIFLNPGWRFTKRTYEGKVLGHVYFSFDSSRAPVMENNGTSPATNSPNVIDAPRGANGGEKGRVLREIVAPPANVAPPVGGEKPQKRNRKASRFERFSEY